ncbi:MAG: hypothetical protein ACLSA6_02815 [Holdemania massiliensis]
MILFKRAAALVSRHGLYPARRRHFSLSAQFGITFDHSGDRRVRVLIRLFRSSMLSALNQDFMQGAQIKGLPRTTAILKYACAAR